MKKILLSSFLGLIVLLTHAQTTVTFAVTDRLNQPIDSATVLFNGTVQNTDSNGIAIFEFVDQANYTYEITAESYADTTGIVNVIGNSIQVNVQLNQTYNISFSIFNEGNLPIEDAVIKLNGNVKSTDSTGHVNFADTNGIVNYTIEHPDYIGDYGALLIDSNHVNKSITLMGKYSITFDLKEFITYNQQENTTIIGNVWDTTLYITFNGVTKANNIEGLVTFNSIYPGAFNYAIVDDLDYDHGGYYVERYSDASIDIANDTVLELHFRRPGTWLDNDYAISDMNTTLNYYRYYYTEDYYINFKEVGSSNYFTVERSSMPHGSGSSTSFNLLWVNGIEYGKSYEVTIDGWNIPGSSIYRTISIGGIPRTYIDGQYWNATYADLNQYLSYNKVSGASNYELVFTPQNGGDPITVQRGLLPYGNGSSNIINLLWIPGIEYGTTYDIKVRAYAYGNWGDFDVEATITIADVTTKLVDSLCGASIETKFSYLNFYPITGASNYELTFSPQSGDPDIVVLRSDMPKGGSAKPNVYLNWIEGLTYGESYDVSIKVMVNNTWGNSGDICTIDLNVPSSKLTANFCDQTLSSLNTYVYYQRVPGATDYQLQFVPQGGGSTIEATRSLMPYGSGTKDYINLIWINGLAYGTTYDVSVRSMVDGIWGSYGTSCTLTIGNVPTTQLSPAYCDITINNLNYYFKYDRVAGANNYEIMFTPQGGGPAIERLRSDMPYGASYSNKFNTWWLGLSYNEIYDVQVRAEVDGVWSSYGPACTVTVAPPAKSGQILSLDTSNSNPSEFALGTYPNPFKESFTLVFNSITEEEVHLFIYDLSGRIIDNKTVKTNENYKLGNDLNPGGYILLLKTNVGEIHTKKLFKTK